MFLAWSGRVNDGYESDVDEYDALACVKVKKTNFTRPAIGKVN